MSSNRTRQEGWWVYPAIFAIAVAIAIFSGCNSRPEKDVPYTRYEGNFYFDPDKSVYYVRLTYVPTGEDSLVRTLYLRSYTGHWREITVSGTIARSNWKYDRSWQHWAQRSADDEAPRYTTHAPIDLSAGNIVGISMTKVANDLHARPDAGKAN